MTREMKARSSSYNTTRNQTPIRYRKARADASIGSIEAQIVKKYGLPEGSVRIVGPNGRKIRSDATVDRLRRRWNF